MNFQGKRNLNTSTAALEDVFSDVFRDITDYRSNSFMIYELKKWCKEKNITLTSNE
jgi:hypothetical protein